MHPLLIMLGKFFIGMIPGVDSEASWTITNLAYMVVSNPYYFKDRASTLAWLALIPHVPLGHGRALRSRGTRWGI